MKVEKIDKIVMSDPDDDPDDPMTDDFVVLQDLTPAASGGK